MYDGERREQREKWDAVVSECDTKEEPRDKHKKKSTGMNYLQIQEQKWGVEEDQKEMEKSRNGMEKHEK